MRLARRLIPPVAAATLVAAACVTERPEEHFRPLAVATGGATTSSSGGSAAGAATGFGGGGGEGGASPSSGGGPASGGGSSSSGGTTGGGGTATGGSGGAWPNYDCAAPTGETPAFTRQALRAAAASCAEYSYCRFQAAAGVLADSVQELELEATTEHAELARAAWFDAMREWSVLELMQFGPMASATPTDGRDIYQGHGVRALVHSWPQVSRCRVDEQVALQKYVTLGMDGAVFSSRGLDGLETLLYYQGLDTECALNSSTADVWATLDAAAIAERRRGYAGALADDVLGHAQGLVQTWSPTGGNFRDTFVSASGYPDEQEAMNVLGWALMYMELEVKDWKFGVPLGYSPDAPVDGPEARYAGEQTAFLRANMEGFRRVFQGCGPEYGGVGFDDWLIDAGHADLAADIIQASLGAEAALAALPRFAEADTAQLTTTYAAIKALTDLLKADLFGSGSPINLELPATLEGDVD